jgi:FAD:protein FMN transferase
MRKVVVPTSMARVPPRAPGEDCIELQGESMGTTWQVRVAAPASAIATVQAVIDAALALVVQQMSHWEPTSDLSRFNAATAGEQVVLPEILFDLLLRAQAVAAATGGAYDATTGALVRRWGFGPDRARLSPQFLLPGPAEIAALRRACGWDQLWLDTAACTALQPGGMELDLSAIGKGFAVDLVSQRLTQAGHAVHLVEIGGELRGTGVKADGQPWWVTLEPPHAAARLDEIVIALCDQAVATSGDYRRWHEQQGYRYAHTLDPRTGRPLRNDLAAVTVISAQCWHADAVSTALMVMGVAEGLKFADQGDIAARFVRRTEQGFVEHCSRAWSEMLQ